MPRHTFFGYRYISVTASDDVEIKSVVSIPVTSIGREHELGEIETGVPYVREEPKIGRNDPCPCGSGKKYKKCCGK